MLVTGHNRSRRRSRGADRPASIVECIVGSQTASPEQAGFFAVSRAVVSAAADLVTGVQRAVVGPTNVRTARGNAWDAILADRARNAAREDLTREVSALVSRSR
jgi:lauroyl/myristoyl acyltransferase